MRKEIGMEKPYSFEKDGEFYTLQDSVEFFALVICDDISKEGQRTEVIMQKCKILNSLSNALLAIKK